MAVSLPSARVGGRVCAIPGAGAHVSRGWTWMRRRRGWEELLERAGAGARGADRARAQPGAVGALARSPALAARPLPGRRSARAAVRVGTARKARLRDHAEGDAAPGSGPDLRFNLSHSDELMLVAVTAGLEVGVDIEVAPDPAHSPVDEPAIAARVLGAEQARRLAALDAGSARPRSCAPGRCTRPSSSASGRGWPESRPPAMRMRGPGCGAPTGCRPARGCGRRGGGRRGVRVALPRHTP